MQRRKPLWRRFPPAGAACLLLLALTCFSISAGGEALPLPVQRFLENEQTRLTSGSGDPRKVRPRTNSMPEELRAGSRAVFPLETYWVPDTDFQAVESRYISPAIRRLFVREEGGHREFRLVVHPLSRAFYEPLLKRARPAPPLMGSATASNRSLVAWVPGKESEPFLAKVSLAEEIGGVVRTIRSFDVPAAIGTNDLLEGAKKELPAGFRFMPETFGIYPQEKPDGGMIIREFRPGFLAGRERSLQLFGLYGGKDPAILSMIRRSGMDAIDFVRKRIVGPFVGDWTELAVDDGVFMEAHGQNVLLGLDQQGMPDGTFEHRDLNGFNVDLAYRKKRGLYVPENLPFLRSVDADYAQAEHLQRIRLSLSTYFEGSFLWDLERHLIQWQKEGKLPGSRPIQPGSLTSAVWQELEKAYRKRTGLARSFPASFFSLGRQGDEPFAQAIVDGRNELLHASEPRGCARRFSRLLGVRHSP